MLVGFNWGPPNEVGRPCFRRSRPFAEGFSSVSLPAAHGSEYAAIRNWWAWSLRQGCSQENGLYSSTFQGNIVDKHLAHPHFYQSAYCGANARGSQNISQNTSGTTFSIPKISQGRRFRFPQYPKDDGFGETMTPKDPQNIWLGFERLALVAAAVVANPTLLRHSASPFGL